MINTYAQNSMLFLSIVNLKIKRTGILKNRCNYPSCNESNNLSRIPLGMRFYIATQEKVYIPVTSVACPRHIVVQAWIGVGKVIKDENTFLSTQIEDMFNLLTNQSIKSILTAALSMYQLLIFSLIMF